MLSISVGFVLPGRFELLDVAGPMEVFAAVERASGGKYRYTMNLISIAEKPLSQTGFSLAPVLGYKRVRRNLNTLLVIGGDGALRSQPPAVLQWLKGQSQRVRRVGSICTGAFVLAQAGLLDGFRAATHWAYCDELKAQFPNVHVDPEPIYIRDGNRITSAGVSAGIDLALALVEEDWGTALANKVARHLVLFLRRSGGQRQFSSLVEDSSVAQADAFTELPAWVALHLKENISVERLARVCKMSPRTFARRFVEEFKTTPHTWVQRYRVQQACALLLERRIRMKEIAHMTGFSDTSVMRRTFVRTLGTSPEEYAKRFGSTAD